MQKKIIKQQWSKRLTDLPETQVHCYFLSIKSVFGWLKYFSIEIVSSNIRKVTSLRSNKNILKYSLSTSHPNFPPKLESQVPTWIRLPTPTLNSQHATRLPALLRNPTLVSESRLLIPDLTLNHDPRHKTRDLTLSQDPTPKLDLD